VGLVEAFLFAFGLFVTATVGAFAYGRWQVRRRLRIRPATRSRVPTWWLLSMSAPARLHRRLRNAAALVRLATARDGSLASVGAELEARAVDLEGELLRSLRAGRLARVAIAEEVTAVETVANHLVASARDASRPGRTDVVAELHERIDAIAAARAELDDIEAQAGLHQAGRVAMWSTPSS